MTNSKGPPLIDTAIERLLEDCKYAYDAGFLPAIYEAACLCEENDCVVPDWLRAALPNVLAKAFSVSRPSMGLPKLVSELRHYMRWMAVRVLVAKGNTWANAYDKARNMLSEDHVQPDTIKKSFMKIQKKLKATTEHQQIYLVLTKVANRLGIEFHPDFSV